MLNFGGVPLPNTIFQQLLQKYGTTGMQMLIVAAQAPDPWVPLWSLQLITRWMNQLCF